MSRLLHNFCEPGTVTLLLILAATAPAVAAEDSYQPTVLITGSNRGIGLEFARQYAALDWKVIATTRRPETATELHVLGEQHPNVVIEQLDVTNESHIATLVAKYNGEPIDLLINNAGISGRSAELDFAYDIADFRDTLDVNTFAPLRISQAFLDSITRSRQKKIVVMASRLGSIEWSPFAAVDSPFATELWYAISKAGVNMGMRRLAAQLEGEGVSVAILFPGPTATDMLAAAGIDLSQIQSPGQTDAKKLQTPEQAVTGMIGFLEELDLEKSGRFFGHDGEEVPW